MTDTPIDRDYIEEICEDLDKNYSNDGCVASKAGAEALRALLAALERDAKVIAAAKKLEGAVDHERNMVCQDIGMQLQTVEAVDQALVFFRNTLAARAGEDTPNDQ